MQRTLKSLGSFVFLACSVLVFAGAAQAAPLIPTASVTYNGGIDDYAYGVATDASGNIIVTGYCRIGPSYDYCTVKYDPEFVFLASATYNSPGSYADHAYGVAVDSSGNIIVTGISSNGENNDYFTIKYSPDLVVLASATYNGPANDYARGVAVDSSCNIIVTGNSNNDYFTIKYDPNLVVIASATYGGPASSSDNACAVAVDSSGNIIVTGESNSDYFTIKYDPNFVVLASARYDSPGSGIDRANGAAVDPSGNIIVTGISSNDFFTIKYDPNLVVLASATYDGPESNDDRANGVAVDPSGNIVVTGNSDNGLSYDCFTIKYSSSLAILASATYAGLGGPAYETGNGVAVDVSGNIIVAGHRGSPGDYFAVKYNGVPPAITGCSPPSAVRGSTAGVSVYGTNFLPGARVSFSGGGLTVISSVVMPPVRIAFTVTVEEGTAAGLRDVTVTNADGTFITLPQAFEITYQSPVLTAISPASGPFIGGTTVTVTGAEFMNGATVTIGGNPATSVLFVSSIALTAVTPAAALAGAKDVVVTNPDSQSVTLTGGFTYKDATSTSMVIDTAADGSLNLKPESGEITIAVSAGTFEQSVTMTVATVTVPSSGQSTIKVTNVGIEITNSAGLQPSKEITLTVYYRDADITGLEESKLTLARYESGRWIPIPTVVYADQNKLVGTVKHLSTFAVVQLAPAADLAGVKVYPNPFNPRNGALTMANLTGEADIKIYNVAGELVRSLSYTSATGQAVWDGKNDGGNDVASGVYLAFIKSSAGKKTVKIAVER